MAHANPLASRGSPKHCSSSIAPKRPARQHASPLTPALPPPLGFPGCAATRYTAAHPAAPALHPAYLPARLHKHKHKRLSCCPAPIRYTSDPQRAFSRDVSSTTPRLATVAVAGGLLASYCYCVSWLCRSTSTHRVCFSRTVLVLTAPNSTTNPDPDPEPRTSPTATAARRPDHALPACVLQSSGPAVRATHRFECSSEAT